MPIELNEEDGGKLLNVHVSGKLTSADYDHAEAVAARSWLDEA